MMYKLFFSIIVTLLSLSCLNRPALAQDHTFIIGFHNKPGSSEQTLVQENGGKVKHRFRHIAAYCAQLSDIAAQQLHKNHKIKYIVEDTLYSAIDPASITTIPVEYQNSWGVEHIGGMEAHTQNITGAGVRVAVLDSGIDFTHQELAANYYGGWDFVFNDDDPFDDSWNSHGTHLAGIIAAVADNAGVVGVAPDAELYAVKVLDGSGFGLLSWIINGIDWAIDHNMDIINISIGGPPSEALQDACDSAYNAGLLLIAAAGNGNEVIYPAAYDSVIAVTGTDRDDGAGWFAPSGPQIELAAPGVDIYSTTAGNDYGELSGTSQAAPHVSGLAALILGSGINDINGDGAIDNRDIRLRLQMSAIDLGDPGPDDVYGYGLIDAAAALGLNNNDGDVVSFDLARQKKGWNDIKAVALDHVNAQVTVTNHSLRGIKVKVFEDGVKRQDLNRKIHFHRPDDGQTVVFSIDAGTTTLDVVFSPIGKPGTSASITITRK